MFNQQEGALARVPFTKFGIRAPAGNDKTDDGVSSAYGLSRMSSRIIEDISAGGGTRWELDERQDSVEGNFSGTSAAPEFYVLRTNLIFSAFIHLNALHISCCISLLYNVVCPFKKIEDISCFCGHCIWILSGFGVWLVTFKARKAFFNKTEFFYTLWKWGRG